MSRAGRRLAASILIAALALAAPVGAANATGVSFTDMEQQFMCTECHEALNVAQSQESFRERQYLRDLIAQGLSAGQVKTQMVAAYGPAVLATPPASGFNLTIYVLPPAIVVIGAVSLAFALPRWRRRTAAAAATATADSSPAPDRGLSADDARRLDEDLARHP